MTEFKLVTADDYATKKDLDRLNNSTPFPEDVAGLNEALGAMRGSVVARVDNLEHRVNRSTRVILICLFTWILLLLVPLAAIIYKLYPL